MADNSDVTFLHEIPVDLVVEPLASVADERRDTFARMSLEIELASVLAGNLGAMGAWLASK